MLYPNPSYISFLLSILKGAVVVVEHFEDNDCLVTVMQFKNQARPVAGVTSLPMLTDQAYALATFLRDFQQAWYG